MSEPPRGVVVCSHIDTAEGAAARLLKRLVILYEEDMNVIRQFDL